MANHSFVTTRRFLTTDKVELDLKYILQKRFGNTLSYKRDGDYFEVGFEYPWTVPLWVENVHKIEFRNQLKDWCWWVQAVIHNEFALMYNGWISDEGVGDKWRGVPDKYPTFNSYLDARNSHLPLATKLLITQADKLARRDTPKEVRATYNGVG